MKFLKLIGVLIDYPQEVLWQHRDELLAASNCSEISGKYQKQLRVFIQNLLDSDPLTAQERWLSLFDRGRSMSLLLFEHIHGESRDRGQAMVDLMDAYRAAGYEIDTRELPDYVPLVLEFLSTQTQEQSRDWLHHVSHILSLLAARCAERESPYQVLFEILIEYADGKVQIADLIQRAAKEVRDDTPEAMDKVWEEEAVRFGPEAPAQDCDAPKRLPQGVLISEKQVMP